MQLVKKYFPTVISDNEESYFSHLRALVDSVDELAILQATRNASNVSFRLSPSLPKYIPLLIEELLKFHNVFNIHLDLSKSIKSTGVLVYKIIL